MKTTTSIPARPIYEIAKEIKKVWTKPFFGAVPYLDAMQALTDKSSKYGMDSGSSIVCYFLANASTFRGEEAKRIKIELNKIIK